MMMVALLAAAASIPAAPPPPAAVVQARATVRIVSGVRVKLGSQNADAQLRNTRFRSADGTTQPAKLVEFQ